MFVLHLALILTPTVTRIPPDEMTTECVTTVALVGKLVSSLALVVSLMALVERPGSDNKLQHVI